MSDDKYLVDDPRFPITPKRAYDENYWRKRAKLTREKARIDRRQSDRLLKAAREYDLLAERAAVLSNEYS